MFKLLTLSFISLFAVPLFANANSSSYGTKIEDDKAIKCATDDSKYLHGYTYTDDEENSIRTFDSTELSPQINQAFCAPTGYVYSLTIDEDTTTEIVDQIEHIGADFSYFNISFYYGIYGSKIYAESDSWWYTGDSSDSIDTKKTWFKEKIMFQTNGLEFLKVDEVINASTIYVSTNIMVCWDETETGETNYWTLVFTSESQEIEPYDEFDFVNYRLTYYQDNDADKRITIEPTLIPGFFNQYSTESEYAYNKYGWLTDTTTPYPYAVDPLPPGLTSHYYCDYELTLIAFDTITMGDFGLTTIEMTYPSIPIKAKIKLEFTSGGKEYTFYSQDFTIGDPDVRLTIDGHQDRKVVQKNTEHTYEVVFDHLENDKLQSLNLQVDGVIDRLIDDGQNVIYCYNGLPDAGVDGVYYYLPSSNEKSLHNAGKDSEFINTPSEGTYYLYEDVTDPLTDEVIGKAFNQTTVVNLIDVEREGGAVDPETTEWVDFDPISEEELESLLVRKITFPFEGRFTQFSFTMQAGFTNNGMAYISDSQLNAFEITPHLSTQDEIILNVGDTVNLIDGGGDITITPKVSSYKEGASYYFDSVLDKDGIITITQDESGKVTVHPLKTGLVSLTFKVDSSEFSEITKTITVRVIDGINDNSKLVVKDEFHKAGEPLTVSLSVRGLSDILNANITWKVTDKKGNEIPGERVIVNDNASMTLMKPDSDDYTVKAYYAGVEISSTTVEVRYLDMDEFLRNNVWWIVLITLGFVGVVIVLVFLSKRSKSTVDRIERVYEVYCQCISNDSLSKLELKKIKRVITRCLHHCEDLNINSFNQYEEAIIYLRKSLKDTKSLMKKYDKLDDAEKGVIYEHLNKYLSKSLTVAKEIEAAKELIEQYHANANRNNYATVKKEKTDKKSKK
ncbi:MAG: hypothetical protein K5906_01450 [Bacilli bacterium]|nr:hypothetical protein [Bacilli bacterium]